MRKLLFAALFACLIVSCVPRVTPEDPVDNKEKPTNQDESQGNSSEEKPYEVTIDIPEDNPIEVEALADSFSFNLTAEGPWDIEVEEAEGMTYTKTSVIPDYITVYPTSGGSGVIGVEVSLAPNYALVTRAIHLLIRHQKKTSTITIIQKPRAYVVDGLLTIAVMEPGGLGTSMDEVVSSRDNITQLRVLGALNDVDTDILYHLKNLAYLDMRGCSVPTINFYYHRGIEVVYLPDSMTELPKNTFTYCSALKYIHGENVIRIGPRALAQTTALEECYFPNVEQIEEEAFRNCKALTQLVFPKVKTIGGGAFDYCERVKTVSFDSLTEMTTAVLSGWRGPANLEQVNLPALRKVCNQAFEYQTQLKTLELPSLVDLGSHILNYSSVEEIILPSLTYIPTKAFYNCTSLRRVYCEKVETVGESAFAFCERLKDVIMPKATSLDPNAFYGCTLGGELDFSSVMFIGDYCFKESSGLGSHQVQFPVVLSIGNYAFENCVGLVSIVMPLVTSIGHGAFMRCQKLSVVGQDNELSLLTSLGSYAFFGCGCLSQLLFPCLIRLGSNCFNGTSLSYLEFGALPWYLKNDYGMAMAPFEFWSFPIDETANNIDLVIPNGEHIIDADHPWWRTYMDGSETFLACSWRSVNGYYLKRGAQ